MRKVLFGCLFFSFFASFGQITVTSPVDDIADTKSLRHAIANWDGFSEIILDVDKIVLDEDQGDILIPQGMCIKSTGKTIIKGDATTYQHFRIGGYRMGNRPSIKPASVSSNAIVFEGITFTEFGNTPLYIVDYYVDLELKKCVFEKNIIMPAKNDPLVLNQTISDESRAAAIGVGNDLYSKYNVGTVVITNTDFVGNEGHGVGAVYLNQASLTLENVNFDGNKAKKYSYTSEGDGGPMSHTDGFGGAITVLGGQAILKNSIFKGNEADLLGGSVYQDSNGELTIDKCDFIDSKSQEEGGAIYTKECEVTLDNSYFTGCSSVIGGVICARDGVFLELTNNTIVGNGLGILPDKGGVIYSATTLGGQNYGANIQLNFNTIANNVVSDVSNPNAAVVEIYDEMDISLAANIIVANGRDLFTNKEFTMYGGNFVEKPIGNLYYDGSYDNFIDSDYKDPGLEGVVKTINGRNVFPLKPCGAAAMNVLPRTSSDGLPNEDALDNSRFAFTHSDAGAYEVQRVQKLSVSTVDTVLVTTDVTKILSDIKVTNDCNTEITQAEFTLTNFDYEEGGLKILDNITYDSTLNYSFNNKGTIGIKINQTLSKSYIETILSDKFIVTIKNRTMYQDPILNYVFIDNGGDTVKGEKVVIFPEYPQPSYLDRYEYGIADTITVYGTNIQSTAKIKIHKNIGQDFPTTQADEAEILKVDFIGQSNTKVSFIVPSLKEDYYQVELQNAYGTFQSGGSTSSEFRLKVPEIDSLSSSAVRAGEKVIIYGDYLGGLDTVLVGGQSVVGTSISSYNSTNHADTAWFTMPSITANTATVRASNPAGIAANTPAIRMLKDTIENFSLADATLSPFCLGDEIELSYKPVGAYNAPYDSVILYGELAGVDMEIGAYHVAAPNNNSSLKFKADYQFTSLKLEPKSNAGAVRILPITIQTPPSISILNLTPETCAKDSNGSFDIVVNGVAGVSYTTTVNGDTVTDSKQKNLIPDLYEVVSGFNGCNDTISATIIQGKTNQILDFDVNAPNVACKEGRGVKFNVYNIATSSIGSIEWEWKNYDGAGDSDSIETDIPFLFPAPDSVIMVTRVIGDGCFTPKKLTKETKIPFIMSPYVRPVSSLSNDYICDSTELFEVPFKADSAGPFTLYYSYGGGSGGISNLDSYSEVITDTIFDLKFKYKKPEMNSYYDGQTDSIEYKGCLFDFTQSTSMSYNLDLQLVPTTDLSFSYTGETCFNGNNGTAKIDANPDGHYISWYDGTDYTKGAFSNEETVGSLTPGLYSLVISNIDGYCPDTTNFTINKFTDKPSYDILSEELCAGQDYQFKLENVTASNIQSVDWKIGNTTISGSSSVDTLSPIIKITNQMYEDTLFVSVNVQECGTSKSYLDTLLLKVNRNPNLMIQRNQEEIVVSCGGVDFQTTYKLDSVLSGTVWYSLQDDQSIMTNQNISVNASDLLSIATNFEIGTQVINFDSVITGTCTFGLGGDLSTELIGYNKPSVTDLQIQDEKCIGDSNGVLIAKSIGKLHWLNDKNLIISKQDTVSALAAGSYQVFATASTTGDCPSDTLEAVIKPGLMKDSVSFMLSGSDSVCSNLNLELGIASSKGKGTFTWTYNGSVIQSNTDSSYQLSQALVSTSNTYKIVMKNEAICKANVEYVMSGSVTELTVPQKAVITGDASPICSTNPVFKVNKLQEDSIVWTVSPTGLDLDYHNGDSLSIYSLENSVQLFAKLESNEGCVGEISDVFAVKPQGCALSAALAVLTDASGNAMDTVCRSSLFIAVNTSVGDYTSTKWKINDTVISTSSDTLRYDLSKLPSGTYDLEIVVENVAKKDSTTLAQAFTVVDTLPSQDILGNQYSCFGEQEAYYFNTRDLAIIQNATWSAVNGTLKDSLYSGDSLITLFTPIDVNAQSGLALTLTSTCNEQKTYSKAIMNFSEDLSVLTDTTICNDSVTIIIPPVLNNPNYNIGFSNGINSGLYLDPADSSQVTFVEDGNYLIEFKDLQSSCKTVDTLVVGTIPGFSLKGDILFTKKSEVANVDILIDTNDTKFIDVSNYVLDTVKYVSPFAKVTLDTVANTLTYQLINDSEMKDGKDSLYYYGKNKKCNIIDSALVYVFIPQPGDDIFNVAAGVKDFVLDPNKLLVNDSGGLDTIVFDVDTTYTAYGRVDTNGVVTYVEYPSTGIDTVYYKSCKKDGAGSVLAGSCRDSKMLARFSVLSEFNDGEEVPEGKQFFDLQVYNVVTPDGDGVHDYFKIILIEKETREVYPLRSNYRSTLQIFTKWGDLVYESENYVFDDENQFFRGKTESGEDLPNGTYYFVYDLKVDKNKNTDNRITDLSKGFYTESGFLILKRP